MPRRINRALDIERTERLNLEELYVEKGKGDDIHYFAWLEESEIESCPHCGGNVIKVQNRFSRNLRDVIPTSTGQRVISLEYEFYKYRCLNEDCRHIFAKEISFASHNDNITYRLEDVIAKLVVQGLSYNDIATRFSGSLTRQAVGQIFNRWVHKKEELRRTQTLPSSLCVITGRTDKDQYTLFLNLDDGIRVFDILYGVNSLDIISELKTIGLSSIATVLTDCNPTINDIINDNLPESTYIIPVEYWFKLVSEDFKEYATEQLKWRQEGKKLEIVMTPEAELVSVIIRDNLLESRPALKQPYNDYNELHRLIFKRDEPWTYTKLRDWTITVCEEFQPQLYATILRLNIYKEAIHQHELHRELVPDGLYRKTADLEEILSNIKTFSEEQLKARVLYSVPSDLEHWQGIPLSDVIKELTRRDIQKIGGNKYEYR